MNPPVSGILTTVGNTPLVELTRALPDARFKLFAKLEGFNPGGSIKDRPALEIIQRGIESGRIRPGTVIVESSSGNLGIGLAQTCLYLGLRFICVIDPKTTAQNRRLLETYGAELDLVTQPDSVTGEFLPARLARVHALLDILGDAFWPNQYASPSNAAAHHRTMQEIDEALDGEIDYLFCSTSTCGTLRGCAEYARDHLLDRLTIFAVDAVGSVIFGGSIARRLIPGHGAAVRPALFREGLAQECVHITDWECVVGCRKLLSCEALLVGGSSGATFMAAKQMQERIQDGATVVLVFPDRGERYLDTIFSDDWVMRHFGETSRAEQRELVSEVPVGPAIAALM
jgi:2,3-diaminopropionate biosynthesis protein SbnA